jgi:hypothetical protein
MVLYGSATAELNQWPVWSWPTVLQLLFARSLCGVLDRGCLIATEATQTLQSDYTAFGLGGLRRSRGDVPQLQNRG